MAGEYGSNIRTTGYQTENEALAGALAGAAAIKQQNPDAKITVAVGLSNAIGQMQKVELEDNSNNGGNK